jgi:HicB family
MKRKRAPGGGRKPQGPFKENRARLSLRVTPDIHRALVAMAEKSGHSVTQVVQFHLQQSLSRYYDPRPDTLALTDMIARAIQDVERTTDAKWTQNAFTTAAIRAAIDSLVRHWGASGEPKVPIAIKKLAKRQPDDYARQFQEPAEVGSWAAGRLITEIEARGLVEDEGPHKLPADSRFPPSWTAKRPDGLGAS